MRICVYGAGAIGGHLAVRLARGGADVSVVARGPHLAAIQRDGLTVHTSDGSYARGAGERRSGGARAAGCGDGDGEGAGAARGGRRHRAAAASDTPVAFVMNGIPWWYFHGSPAHWKAAVCRRSIRTTRCGARSGPSGRSPAWSMPPAR